MSKKNCGCGDFNSLLVLILILTQFGRGQNHGHGGCHDGGETPLIDNSLLFLVALFLCTCGCCGFKRSCAR